VSEAGAGSTSAQAEARLSREIALHSSDFDVESFFRLLLPRRRAGRSEPRDGEIGKDIRNAHQAISDAD
jgi:hypothetical protein